mgnify:CR=1 FL=1
MKPIIHNQKINLSALLEFYKDNLGNYIKRTFYLALVYCLFFLIKTPTYESTVTFYTNYQSDESQSLFSLFPSSIAGLASDQLRFSVKDYISSEKLLHDVVNSKFIIKTSEGNKEEYLKNEWGKNYDKVFSPNPLGLISGINRALMYNPEVTDEAKKIEKAKKRLKRSMTFMEDRRTLLNTIVVEVDNDGFLAQQIAESIYSSIIKYSNEVQNLKGLEKSNFISSRLDSVKIDLELSEEKMISFLEKNVSLSSPSLVIERDRLQKSIDLNNQLFFSLTDQLEIARIEENDNTSSVYKLDSPEISVRKSGLSLARGGFYSVIFGMIFFFILDIYKKRKKLIFS